MEWLNLLSSQSTAFYLQKHIRLKNHLLRHLHWSRDTLRIPESANNFEVFRHSKTCLSFTTGLILSNSISTSRCTLVKKNLIEKCFILIVASPQIFDSPKFPKDAHTIGLSQSSNSYFSLTTCLISSFEFSIRKSAFRGEISSKNYSET